MHPSTVVKRSVVVGHHKTSVSLEPEFWERLRAIANERHSSLAKLLSTIDQSRDHSNLSSAIRLYVLKMATAARDEEEV
jgi:predicted DNA-binding ribbon-helix-helix protein